MTEDDLDDTWWMQLWEKRQNESVPCCRCEKKYLRREMSAVYPLEGDVCAPCVEEYGRTGQLFIRRCRYGYLHCRCDDDREEQ